jgi:hypothetical protein
VWRRCSCTSWIGQTEGQSDEKGIADRQHRDAFAAQNLPAQAPLPSPAGTAPKSHGPPDSDPPPPSPPPSRWAALLARIYEVLPLICPTCQTPLTFIALLTDPEPIAHILAQIGEPTSPPRLHPARGPPQAELAFELGASDGEEIVQEYPPDNLDQTPQFDPAEPDPIPDDDFDHSLGD